MGVSKGINRLIIFPEAKIKIDEPQGSVLGSLLFLVYVSNLPTVYSILHGVLFADDTCLTLAADKHSNLINTFSSELKNVYA